MTLREIQTLYYSALHAEYKEVLAALCAAAKQKETSVRGELSEYTSSKLQQEGFKVTKKNGTESSVSFPLLSEKAVDHLLNPR